MISNQSTSSSLYSSSSRARSSPSPCAGAGTDVLLKLGRKILPTRLRLCFFVSSSSTPASPSLRLLTSAGAGGIDTLGDRGEVPSNPNSAIVGREPSSVSRGKAICAGTRLKFLALPPLTPASPTTGGAGPGWEILRGLFPRAPSLLVSRVCVVATSCVLAADCPVKPTELLRILILGRRDRSAVFVSDAPMLPGRL